MVDKKKYAKNIENLILELISMGIKDKRVIEAIRVVPRYKFIRKKDFSQAYANFPLPIGFGQTISQPFTVAYMVELLELSSGDKVLEIGSGSGYNAAIMSKVVGKKGRIYSLEIIQELAEFSKNNLKNAIIDNVEVICTDGSMGYPKQSPFDAIIVTAASPQIPEVLINQIKLRGNIVCPVRSLVSEDMIKLKKQEKNHLIENYGKYSFVPLRGKFGFK